MTNAESDSLFTGSIPEIYERYLVPLIFEFYAADLAARLASRSVDRVLEIAAGTGVLTRHLASVLPDSAPIVATDLNQPMLDHASSIGTRRPVEWRQADAMRRPFPDEAFDVVVCQFGVMFFPDKARSFSEAHRVLSAGGVFIFNVWDRIESNEFLTRSRPRSRPSSRTTRPASWPASRTATSTIARSNVTSPRVGSPNRRRSALWPREARPTPRGSRRSRSVRERPCATRSRSATRRVSAKQPMQRPPRSPRGSAGPG